MSVAGRDLRRGSACCQVLCYAGAIGWASNRAGMLLTEKSKGSRLHSGDVCRWSNIVEASRARGRMTSGTGNRTAFPFRWRHSRSGRTRLPMTIYAPNARDSPSKD